MKDSQISDYSKSKDKEQVLKNGLVLEGLSESGLTQIVSASSIHWIRDVNPFFLATYVMIMLHVFYYFTGNLAIPIFLVQSKILYSYAFDQEKLQDKQNISTKSQREFFNDNRFFIPLYTCVAAGTFTWMWSLCLMSDDVKFESYYLSDVRPKTWPQYLILVFVLAFISSVETQAGHELIHRREYYNKAVGMLANAKIFYTHFKDEHVQGHHKMLATPEDSSTSRLNESIYAYIPREVYWTHVNQWKREVKRIRKLHGHDCPTMALILLNKMTWYFLIHVAICVSVYCLLGWNSLKFQFLHAAFGLWYQCFANYITHYGLLRNKDKNGIYESINKYHSWNFVSSPIYFRLPRHSDHHISSFRPY